MKIPAYDEDPSRELIALLHSLHFAWEGDECGLNIYLQEEPLCLLPGNELSLEDGFLWIATGDQFIMIDGHVAYEYKGSEIVRVFDTDGQVMSPEQFIETNGHDIYEEVVTLIQNKELNK